MILVVGDVITDIIAIHSGALTPGSDVVAGITLGGGGSAANTAAWLGHLRAPVALVGVAGDDDAGTARLAELTAAGVDCSAVRRTPDAPTGSVIVLSQQDDEQRGHERTMLSDRGASRLLAPSDVDAALDRLPTVTRIHLSAHVLLDPASRPAGLHVLGLGLPVSVDAAPLPTVGDLLPWVEGCSLLLANLAEARALAGSGGSPSIEPPETLAAFLASYVEMAVVKLGPAGAVWAARSAVVSVPATAVEAVVDPTGAGDAFAAGLLAALDEGQPPAAALAEATRAGAEAVTIVGGRPSPTARGRAHPGR